MNKLILFIFIFFSINICSYADIVLEGGVKYDVDTARTELTYYPPPNPRLAIINENLYDKNIQENVIYLLKGNVKLKDRELAFFSDNTYGVIYKKNKQQVFYYDATGMLMFLEIRDSLSYPYKSYKYNTKGELVNMGLRVSHEETFIYKPDGTLIAHWIKNLGFDAHGNIIMKRQYIE